MGVTDTQRRMMRHMLGLPNRKNRSYRNRYFAPPGGPAALDLAELRKAGLAETQADGASIFACLTRAGAEAVLKKGETLCAEDFPPTVAEEVT